MWTSKDHLGFSRSFSIPIRNEEVLLSIAATAIIVWVFFSPLVARAQVWTKIAPHDLLWQANFGRDLAVINDYLLVSDNGDDTFGAFSGAVRIYKIEEDTITFHQKILPSSGMRNGSFGQIFASNGKDVFVSGGVKGEVYQFRLIVDQFIMIGMLQLPTKARAWRNVWSVEMRDEWAFIGFRDTDGGQVVHPPDLYGVFVFKLVDDGWLYHSKLTPPDEWSGDSWYGRHVCVHQNTLAVSATRDDQAGEKVGAVYLYELIDNKWMSQLKLMGLVSNVSARFGNRIACGENELIVDAFGSSKTYAYERRDSTWVKRQFRIPIPGSVFKSNVEHIMLSDNLLILSQSEYSSRNEYLGMVSAFRRVGDSWLLFRKFGAPDPSLYDGFGSSIVLTDNYLIAAAIYQDNFDESGTNLIGGTGAVYITRRESFLPIVEIPPLVDIPDLPSFTGFQFVFPNPADQHSYLNYSVSDTAPVSIALYDILGRSVREELDTIRKPGEYVETIDVSSLPSGLYFYRISIGRLTATKSLTVIH